MNFKKYTDVNEFYNATYELLLCHEGQNLIPLGNIILGKEGKDKSGWRDPANWFMATVSDVSGIQLVAIMTPPHNITLYAKDNKIDEAAVSCLISGIGDVPVPGVMARKDMAVVFAKPFCAAKKLTFETKMEQRIYELTEVNPDIAHVGELRLVEESDMYFIPYWMEALYSTENGIDKNMRVPQNAEDYLYRMVREKMYVLQDNGKPVSMVGTHREMQTVCGVGPVYTPPYFRRKGYASSAVAKASQAILDRGFTKCVLYTDLANPTSNSIYQKIGYRPICDSIMLQFC
jgi:predicted GNAT family acetyltransferase